jgi:hypothetical protein
MKHRAQLDMFVSTPEERGPLAGLVVRLPIIAGAETTRRELDRRSARISLSCAARDVSDTVAGCRVQHINF